MSFSYRRTILYYIVLWSSSYMAVNYRNDGSLEDIVATDIGVKIEKRGKIVSVFEDVIISVIIKLPNITGTGYLGGIAESRLDTCNTISRDFQKGYKRLIQVTGQETREYVSSRLEILQAFVTPTFTKTTNSTRHRRGLLSFLGSSLISLAIGGISEYQIYKINQHVSKNSDAINSIKQALNKEQAVIKSFNKQVVGFVNDITDSITRFSYEQSCDEFYSALAIKIKHTFWECRNTIDNTLWSALSGKNNLILTPRMINLKILKIIVNEHTVLNNTIFHKHPETMYSLAKLSLIEISENLNFAHFVLQIPLISENEIMDLYQSAQVGMHLENNNCIYYKLPKHLYKLNKIFYPISLEKCKEHNNLHVCSKETFSNKSACIQQTTNDCKILNEECYNYYQFDMSQVGILIRNNKDNNTFVIDKEGWTTAVNLKKHRTAYLSWGTLKAIQIGETLIDSPNMAYTPLIISNLSFETSEYYFDGENVTNTFSLICKKYNSTLGDIISPIVDHWYTRIKHNSHLNILWYASVAIVITAIVSWIVYLQCVIQELKSSIHLVAALQRSNTPYSKLIKDPERNSV